MSREPDRFEGTQQAIRPILLRSPPIIFLENLTIHYRAHAHPRSIKAAHEKPGVRRAAPSTPPAARNTDVEFHGKGGSDGFDALFADVHTDVSELLGGIKSGSSPGPRQADSTDNSLTMAESANQPGMAEKESSGIQHLVTGSESQFGLAEAADGRSAPATPCPQVAPQESAMEMPLACHGGNGLRRWKAAWSRIAAGLFHNANLMPKARTRVPVS